MASLSVGGAVLVALFAAGCGGSPTPAVAPSAGSRATDEDARLLAAATSELERGQPRAAIALLERGLDAADARGERQEVVRARLLLQLGRTHLALREGARAAEYLEQASRLNARLYGPTHTDTLDTLELLGICADLLGDHRLAERRFRGVLEACEATGRADTTDCLRVRVNLAVNLELQDRLEEAERAAASAISALERADDSELLGRAVRVLAGIYQRRGDLLRAREAYTRAIGLLSPIHGADSPEVQALIRQRQTVEGQLEP